jgi:hypothetical protein
MACAAGNRRPVLISGSGNAVRTLRPDLAAALHPLTQALIEAELPILAAHGLSMWGYVVLSALDGGPVCTQAALAEQMNQALRPRSEHRAAGK